MDRFFKGFLAGIAGGIIMSIWDLISFHILDFSKHRYLDWSSVLLMGEKPENLIESIYALFIHFMWAGFLGIIFAYLIIVIKSNDLLLKGAILGFIAGFIFYAIPKLFETVHLFSTPIESVISNHVGAVIWGIATAYVFRFLDCKYSEQN